MAFHWVAVLFALTLIADAVYPAARAQSPQSREELQDLGRRVGVLEGMDISAQLAAIHQELVDMHKSEEHRDSDWKPVGTAIAAGALVLERAVKAMSGRVREADAT